MRTVDIYEVAVQVCQWQKDEYACEPCTDGVFTTALTSLNASAHAPSYLNRKQLRSIVTDALAEMESVKRRRIRY